MGEVLYNIKRKGVDIFTMDINTHTQINGHIIQEGGKVEIKFVNGKFSNCDFSFKNHPYNRSAWYVLAEIEKKIRQIEDEYALADTEKKITKIERQYKKTNK